MNKRIEELAIQASLSYVMTADRPFINEDLQKFAELIVKECADQLDDSDLDGVWARGVLHKHFGIKEN